MKRHQDTYKIAYYSENLPPSLTHTHQCRLQDPASPGQKFEHAQTHLLAARAKEQWATHPSASGRMYILRYTAQHRVNPEKKLRRKSPGPASPPKFCVLNTLEIAMVDNLSPVERGPMPNARATKKQEM